MNAIQIKNSCKRVNHFLKEGGKLLENKIDNKIAISYYNYLKLTNNKENTIFNKLRYVLLLNQYLKIKLLKVLIKKIFMIILIFVPSYLGV